MKIDEAMLPGLRSIPIKVSSNINDYAVFNKRAKDAKEYLELIKFSLPYTASSVIDEIIDKVDVRAQENEKSFSQQMAPVDTLIRTIEKNCSIALNTYQKRNFVYFANLEKTDHFLYGKVGNNQPIPNFEFSKTINDFLKISKFDINYENSIMLNSVDTSINLPPDVYMIFPRNGFKCLWSNTFANLYEINMISILFDDARMQQAFDELKINDPDYRFVKDYAALFGWSFPSHLERIKRKVQSGELDRNILELFDPRILITEKSFVKKGDFRNEFDANTTSILMNGEFYAVSHKYKEYFLKKLGII